MLAKQRHLTIMSLIMAVIMAMVMAMIGSDKIERYFRKRKSILSDELIDEKIYVP